MKDPCRKDLCDSPRGINKLDPDRQAKVDPVKQPIERNSKSSGNTAHSQAPSFDDPLDHCIGVFTNKQTCFLAGQL